MLRRRSAFNVSSLLPALLCSAQGLPGEGGGGTPPTPPASGTAPAGESAGNAGQFKPEWLNERIAQAKTNAAAEARASLLKELGVPDAAAAAKLLEDGKKAADAQLTELQRRDARIKELEPATAQAAALRDALAKRVGVELATLPEAAQASIKALAGDDPIKVLEAIDLAKAMAGAPTATPPSGAPQPAPAAPAQGTKPPVAPAANTTAAAGGPPSAAGSPPDHLAVWQGYLDKGNPMAAAQYFAGHEQEIVAAKLQKSSA
jgi:hypothetical protein